MPKKNKHHRVNLNWLNLANTIYLELTSKINLSADEQYLAHSADTDCIFIEYILLIFYNFFTIHFKFPCCVILSSFRMVVDS